VPTAHAPRRVIADGYTMVELIIVVVLVGFLTAAVGTVLMRTAGTGGSAACEQSKDAAAAAVMTHYTTMGSYPSGFAAMLDSGSLQLGPSVVVDRTSRWASTDEWRLQFLIGSPPSFRCELVRP
jgi:prepilin-type N-terminal cleavage/methylation domain-containing protein